MKKICFCMLLISCLAFSQNKQLLYGFSEIPQSLLSNPGGKVTNTGYFGIPLISHLHFNVGTSGATVYDLFAVDGIDFNTKIRNVINNSTPEDFYTANQQLEVFSGGFAFGSSYNKNKYLSFGLYEELDYIMYFPKDIAILGLYGNQSSIGKPFRANNVSVSAEVVSVWHVGYNEKVNDKFTYGVRGKIYSSLVNANSTGNEGAFTTLEGENNIYQHVFNLDLELQTSGYASFDGENRFEPEDVPQRILFGGNLGLGFDVGFTYNLSDQLSVDASLQDIGFIRHTKKTQNYKVSGNYVFEGVNAVFIDQNNGQTATEVFNNIEEEFGSLFDLEENRDAYTTWRPIKFNSSINYAFGKEKIKDCNCLADESPYINSIGAQLFAVARPKGPQLALTTYYYRRLFKGLRVKAAYTLDSYSFSNIGFGLSAHIGAANFYLLADNFLQYRNIYDAQSVSLQLGFNYIFNNK